jgi:hypothetical protein
LALSLSHLAIKNLLARSLLSTWSLWGLHLPTIITITPLALKKEIKMIKKVLDVQSRIISEENEIKRHSNRKGSKIFYEQMV